MKEGKTEPDGTGGIEEPFQTVMTPGRLREDYRRGSFQSRGSFQRGEVPER